jgi:hypothetical protein
MTVDSIHAMKFFEACETGKGWAGCAAHCTSDATFASQAEPLADMTTLAEYADWKGLLEIIPDGTYSLKSFAVDSERGNVSAFAVFSGTHTGDGGPVPATGRSTKSDYVYVMELDGGKVSHLTKIWHAGWAMKDLGWA